MRIAEQMIVDKVTQAALPFLGRPVRDGVSVSRDRDGSFWLWFRRSW